ncbi:MAG: phosphoglyceromutase [Rhodothermales bacterium]|nr:phosphoglyceromutase [Rhodothermales bacterium]
MIIRFVSIALLTSLGACSSPGGAADPKQPRVVLATIDGLRWEEVFAGLDSTLAEATRTFESLAGDFHDPDPARAREKLMPWMWSVVAQEGVLLGNRHLGSDGIITNGQYFSYPSYNELLTGQPDDRIDSNDKIPNPNVTVLEWLSGIPAFEGSVAAFGSWDVFPFILNAERSGLPVNAGFAESADADRLPRESFLNTLQAQTPSPWGAVRLDVFTHQYALAYLERAAPRVLYVAYGETDDFAHNTDHAAYVRAAHRTDRFLQDLWGHLQADPAYAGRTPLIIPTDHGRGSGEGWIGHGTGLRWAGSEYTWMAAIGPSIRPLGEAELDFELRQIAATVAAAVGEDFAAEGAAPPIEEILD